MFPTSLAIIKAFLFYIMKSSRNTTRHKNTSTTTCIRHSNAKHVKTSQHTRNSQRLEYEPILEEFEYEDEESQLPESAETENESESEHEELSSTPSVAYTGSKRGPPQIEFVSNTI